MELLEHGQHFLLQLRHRFFLHGKRLHGARQSEFGHLAAQFRDDALGRLRADEWQLFEKRPIATLDGQSDFAHRAHQAFERAREPHAGNGRKGFKEFPVERIEKAHELRRQVPAAHRAVNVIDRVKRHGVLSLVLA